MDRAWTARAREREPTNEGARIDALCGLEQLTEVVQVHFDNGSRGILGCLFCHNCAADGGPHERCELDQTLHMEPQCCTSARLEVAEEALDGNHVTGGGQRDATPHVSSHSDEARE